ncbi:alpha-hydroxy acid oxidase [Litorisediminicola beolgyonensis]|uniref:Alpha-hydroxy acid oxidase n=1 Tax=Litorisediminicola beolgyonensis TaxID=1173614 RepID=A0ABW3ZNE8_9RHOB
MDLDARYPALSDLRTRARRRLPHFVWEYLDSGTGSETAQARNRDALDRVLFLPAVLRGEVAPDLATRFLGTDHTLPFGVAPVGMSGLIWPRAEAHLARAATEAGLPYTLSTVAAATPEEIGPLTNGRGWYQLYPPRDEEVRLGMLRRIRDSGFLTLVLTVDVPVASRRERLLRSGLTQPVTLTPRLLAQVARRPAWALGMAREGLPRMRTLTPYTETGKSLSSTAHVGYLLRIAPDWDYLRWLRDRWQGPLVVKGVLTPEDAARLEREGVDAVWVSNHAGRQFDGAPAVARCLPAIRAACDLPLLADGGVEGGLDILRLIALGADLVMLGRPVHMALAALGPRGPSHLIETLRRDLIANLGQLGVARPAELRGTARVSGRSDPPGPAG